MNSAGWYDWTEWADGMVAAYAAMLEAHHNFAIATYGDGEWMCILGEYPSKNANSERFYPELGEALAESLRNPTGQWCALWPKGSAANAIRPRAEAWMRENAPDVTWLPFRPLGWANIAGRAAPLFRALKRRRVVLVGPEHLKAVPLDVLRPVEHVVVSATKASDEWMDTVDRVAEVAKDDDVILVAAGMCAGLIVHRLGWLWPARSVTAWDIGAVLDPYAGVYSRKVYRHAPWRANVMPANIP